MLHPVKVGGLIGGEGRQKGNVPSFPIRLVIRVIFFNVCLGNLKS